MARGAWRDARSLGAGREAGEPLRRGGRGTGVDGARRDRPTSSPRLAGISRRAAGRAAAWGDNRTRGDWNSPRLGSAGGASDLPRASVPIPSSPSRPPASRADDTVARGATRARRPRDPSRSLRRPCGGGSRRWRRWCSRRRARPPPRSPAPGPRAAAARAAHRGLPRPPALERVEPRHLEGPGRPALGRLHRRDRPGQPASGLRRAPLRHPDHRRGDHAGPGPGALHRLRGRERPGPVPDPADGAGRGRLGPPRPRRPARPLPPVRAVRRPARRRRLDGVQRRGLRPALEPRAARGLDVGRRRRPADHAGLARASEASAGAIRHALRFTVRATQKAYVAPARHFASADTDPALPPMGLRLRLKAGFDLRPYHGQARVILRALRTYGMIVADNGSSWFISGAPGPGLARRRARPAQARARDRVRGRARGTADPRVTVGRHAGLRSGGRTAENVSRRTTGAFLVGRYRHGDHHRRQRPRHGVRADRARDAAAGPRAPSTWSSSSSRSCSSSCRRRPCNLPARPRSRTGSWASCSS